MSAAVGNLTFLFPEVEEASIVGVAVRIYENK